MRLRVLVAPSGFKESLSADEVADSIAIGIRRAVPDALVRKAPMADGGEGFAAALALATGGQLHPVRVTGPVGKKVDAAFAMLGGDRHEPTAVFDGRGGRAAVGPPNETRPADDDDPRCRRDAARRARRGRSTGAHRLW